MMIRQVDTHMTCDIYMCEGEVFGLCVFKVVKQNDALSFNNPCLLRKKEERYHSYLLETISNHNYFLFLLSTYYTLAVTSLL